MPAEQEGVSGLYYGWASGDSGMKLQMDANWLKIGALLQISVISRSLTAAPGSPVDGACYIPDTGSTGAWVGREGELAVWRESDNAWEFYQPKDGWTAVVTSEGTWGTLIAFKTGAWSAGLTLT